MRTSSILTALFCLHSIAACADGGPESNEEASELAAYGNSSLELSDSDKQTLLSIIKALETSEQALRADIERLTGLYARDRNTAFDDITKKSVQTNLEELTKLTASTNAILDKLNGAQNDAGTGLNL
jgi:hypothetical protein